MFLLFHCRGIKIQEENVFGYAWEIHTGDYAWTAWEQLVMLMVQLGKLSFTAAAKQAHKTAHSLTVRHLSSSNQRSKRGRRNQKLNLMLLTVFFSSWPIPLFSLSLWLSLNILHTHSLSKKNPATLFFFFLSVYLLPPDIHDSVSCRTNLELELVHRGGNLCSGGASAAAKRSCLSEYPQISSTWISYKAMYPLNQSTHMFDPWYCYNLV